jgi:preprotein translocase subunit SecD
MKTIVYSLIAILIFSIIATAFTSKANSNNSILIQSTDKNTSSVLLSQSAKIISDRLKDFSSEKFDVAILPEKNQIQVVLTNTWDLKATEYLLIQKGTLAFYETYDRKSFTEFLNGDSHLFSLFNNSNANISDAEIGCTSVAAVEKVTDYVNNLGLNQKCKFAWSQYFDDSDVCLYALKKYGEKGALLTGTDIESVTYDKDTASINYEIEISLKKSAIEVWSDATKRNINKVIAIVLDDNVISAPRLNTVIEGGYCVITGNFTENQVRYIAALMNNGELPLNFKIVK